jgi:HD-GYP domain-containing protein (c-di-GMP phosphodiesterase class II)
MPHVPTIRRGLPDLSRNVHVGIIVVGLVASTAVVYITGGTHTAGPQLMYLPILAAAWFFRVPGGLVSGIVAGLLIGPFMPLNVDAGTSQDTTNWLVRLGIFAFLGAALGVGATYRLNQLDDLRRLNDESIRAFVTTIDAKSKHTARHSENVAWYAVQIGATLGLNKSSLDQLRWEGLLHDIGKLTIPDAVLNKPGPLDFNEWQVVKQHPAESVRMLRGVHHYEAYLPSILHHHERFDGAGYPDGIQAKDIPLHARILAVADSYDAMTSERPYRSAFSPQEALDEIVRSSGSHFDPEIVAAFSEAVQHFHHAPTHLESIQTLTRNSA